MHRIFSLLSIAWLRTAVLLAFVSLALILPGSLSADDNEDLSELWIDLSIGPPLVQLFNERAQEQDIARVEHISQLEILSEINAGKKLVVFKSAEDAIRLIPHIHDEIDIVGYNLEHGPANPEIEQENPVEYIQRLREVADEYDLEVAFGPDHNFALTHAAIMSPYADYLILQIQKVQTEPDTVYDFVLPVLKGARLANPDILASVQIRTEGDVGDLLSMLEPLQDEIDGISILTSEETVEITEELMGELRAIPVQPTRLAEEEPPVIIKATPEKEIVTSDNPLIATIVAALQDGDPVREQAAGDGASEIVAEINDEINDETNKQAGDQTNIEPIDQTGDQPSDGSNEENNKEALSAPENNQRNGSTWLFVAVALVIGFALGAGYVSYKASS